MSIIEEALSGARGRDQEDIARTGNALVELLLRKNRDYGSSAFQTCPLTPNSSAGDIILNRLWDKINRFIQLQRSDAEVEETSDDTMRDLVGYGILWIVLRERLLRDDTIAHNSPKEIMPAPEAPTPEAPKPTDGEPDEVQEAIKRVMAKAKMAEGAQRK